MNLQQRSVANRPRFTFVALAILFGAMLWVLVASKNRASVSYDNHALTGAIMRTGLSGVCGRRIIVEPPSAKNRRCPCLSFLAGGFSYILPCDERRQNGKDPACA